MTGPLDSASARLTATEVSQHASLEALDLTNDVEYLSRFLLQVQALFPELIPVHMRTAWRFHDRGPQDLEDELQSLGAIASASILGVRVDCCGTITAAAVTASVLAACGVPATYYLNHSAPYFDLARGRWGRPQVRASEVARELICHIALTGMEVGLHNDVWGLQDTGMDPIRSLKASLRWLRSLGIPIQGSVSHNTAWIYGVENFQVFTDFSFVDGLPRDRQPLTNMASLGLHYEANFPEPHPSRPTYAQLEYRESSSRVLSEEFMHMYLMQHPWFRRGYEYEIWAIGPDEWVIADYARHDFRYAVNSASVLEQLGSRAGQRSLGVLVLHPEYFCAGLDFATLAGVFGWEMAYGRA